MNSIKKYKLKGDDSLFDSIEELVQYYYSWYNNEYYVLDSLIKNKYPEWKGMTYIEQMEFLNKKKETEEYKNWKKLFKEQPNVLFHKNYECWFSIPHVEEIKILELTFSLTKETETPINDDKSK